MPNHLKFLLSIAVTLVGATAYYFEGARGADIVQWVVAGLVALMIIAIWLFPETQRPKDDRN